MMSVTGVESFDALRFFPAKLVRMVTALYAGNEIKVCPSVWRHVVWERETYGVNIRLLLLEATPVLQPRQSDVAAPPARMCQSVTAQFGAARRANIELLKLLRQEVTEETGVRHTLLRELVSSMVDSDRQLIRSLVGA